MALAFQMEVRPSDRVLQDGIAGALPPSIIDCHTGQTQKRFHANGTSGHLFLDRLLCIEADLTTLRIRLNVRSLV